MAKICKRCGYPKGEPEHDPVTGSCDLALLSTGNWVHMSRVNNPEGDIRQQINKGEVKIIQRLRQTLKEK